MQAVKKLYATLDTIRISNVYIRYMQNLHSNLTQHPFGHAVIDEFKHDSLLLDVVLNNSVVIEGYSA